MNSIKSHALKLRVIYLILFLSFLSGVCGLGYEQLLSRILRNSVGDLFQVHSSILISLFGGLALAAWCSFYFIKLLWLAEILIGSYALLLGLVWRFSPDFLLTLSLPGLHHGASAVLLSFLLVFPFAFLIGL